jgi:DNA-binding MarR family transcriptional regulator
MTNYTSELLKNLQMVSRASRAFFMQSEQRFNGQQRVLSILAEKDGLSQGDLAEILDIRPGSVAELAKKLEKAGYIERKPDENDGRIKRVYLTDAGRAKAEEDAGTQKDLSAAFFAGLTEEEQQQFGESLKKITDGWDEKTRESAAFSGDPFERLQALQEMRGMEDEFGDIRFDNLRSFGKWRNQARREFRDTFPNRNDWRNMTPEEREDMKAKMREEMMEQFGHNGMAPREVMAGQFGHRGRGGRRGPGAPQGRGRQGRNTERTNSNRDVNPDAPSRNVPRDEEANWKDF